MLDCAAQAQPIRMISVRGATKTFHTGFFRRKPVRVLDGLDFEALPGQVTGLLGPNGAGKTTFFRGLCGFEKFDDGQVRVDGLDPMREPARLRGRIAMLPEEPGARLHQSGLAHLQFYGLMMGQSLTQVKREAEACDAALGLSSFWERPFRTYSRGQKARIALARLRLAPQARVLIFDEPSNGLDFETVGRLHTFIREMATEGRTILVASHILGDLRHLCDRLIGLHEGKQASAAVVEAWMSAHGRQEAGLGLDRPADEDAS